MSVLCSGVSSVMEEVRFRVRLGLKGKSVMFHSGEIAGETHGREPNMDLGQLPPGEVGGEEDRFFFRLGNVSRSTKV